MKNKAIIVSLITSFLFFQNASSAPTPTDPKKQTPWGLYVDSKEAYNLKQKHGEKALFIDVRDPVEIQFTGFTDSVDINIPFMVANSQKWDAKKSVLKMEKNPNYVSDIEKILALQGLTKSDIVIVMCRSGGTRGAPAANVLFKEGYKQVYVVTDGFEGSALKEGKNKGWRLKNGWKNSNLPWGYKLNKDKMYYKSTF